MEDNKKKLSKAKRWYGWQIAFYVITILIAAAAIAMIIINYQEYVQKATENGDGENTLGEAFGALALAILFVIPLGVQIIVSGQLVVCQIVAMSSVLKRKYVRKRDLIGSIVCKFIFLVPSIFLFVVFFTKYSIPMFIMHAVVIVGLVLDYVYPVEDCKEVIEAKKESDKIAAKEAAEAVDFSQSDEQKQ